MRFSLLRENERISANVIKFREGMLVRSRRREAGERLWCTNKRTHVHRLRAAASSRCSPFSPPFLYVIASREAVPLVTIAISISIYTSIPISISVHIYI